MPPTTAATPKMPATTPTAIPTVFELPPESSSLELVVEVVAAPVDVAVGALVETAEELGSS